MELLDFLYAQIIQQSTLLRLRLTASPEPRVESGSGSLLSLGSVLRSEKRKHPLIIISSGEDLLLSLITNNIESADLSWSVAEIVSDTPDNIVSVWQKNGCDCLLAVGDADILNLSKSAAACIGYNQSFSAISSKRILRKHAFPPLVAVPFASHGSEALNFLTVKQADFPRFLSAPSIRPSCIFLDPDIPLSLSRDRIMSSGIDGLCLAIEAYLTPEGTREPVRTLAANAVMSYLDTLEPCWNGGGTSAERLRLLEASLFAGSAASRTGPGFTRILCLAVSNMADIPFSSALGIFLPLVLQEYDNEITDRLADLSVFCGILETGTRSARAAAFLSRLRTLIFRIGLGDLPNPISTELAFAIADKAFSVSHAHYAAPAFLTVETCRRITSVLCDNFHE